MTFPLGSGTSRARRALILWIGLCACASAQQYGPGDLVLFRFTPSTARPLRITPMMPGFTTITPSPFFAATLHGAITLGPRNTELLSIGYGLRNLARVTPAGTLTTIQPRSYRYLGALALDEDGHLLSSGGGESIDVANGTTRPIVPAWGATTITLDRDTGDYLIGSGSGTQGTQRWLARYSRGGTRLYYARGVNAGSLLYHPGTGDILVAEDQAVLRLDRQYGLTTLISNLGPPSFFPVSIANLPNDNIAVTHSNGPTIDEYSPSGQFIRTLHAGSTFARTAMVATDTHRVWGLNQARVASLFRLSVRFGAHANKPFVMGASLANRPGIPVAGGRVIPLMPDSLFSAVPSLPGTFRGFTGTLDANGAATPSVVIPPAKRLGGTRLFFAAVVLDPQAPAGIAAVSQTYGTTIR